MYKGSSVTTASCVHPQTFITVFLECSSLTQTYMFGYVVSDNKSDHHMQKPF